MYFYLPVKMHTLFRILMYGKDLCRSNRSYAFFVRSFSCALFICSKKHLKSVSSIVATQESTGPSFFKDGFVVGSIFKSMYYHTTISKNVRRPYLAARKKHYLSISESISLILYIPALLPLRNAAALRAPSANTSRESAL